VIFEKLEISVPMPSAPAMFINMANEMYNKAIKLREKYLKMLTIRKKADLALMVGMVPLLITLN